MIIFSTIQELIEESCSDEIRAWREMGKPEMFPHSMYVKSYREIAHFLEHKNILHMLLMMDTHKEHLVNLSDDMVSRNGITVEAAIRIIATKLAIKVIFERIRNKYH